MVLVVIYLAIAFEWRMAVAALVALIHDITITVGIYALVGFEVTPGTVIGLLTILGYSLYDTVIIFDSLKEQTKDITKQTRYTLQRDRRPLDQRHPRPFDQHHGGRAAAGRRPAVHRWRCPRRGHAQRHLALSLFVGLAAGAYSSIFIATPLIADLKEREPQMKAAGSASSPSGPRPPPRASPWRPRSPT